MTETKTEQPKEKCSDANCPFHGYLRTRQKTVTGKIIAARMRRTATLEIERRVLVKKYHRYEKKLTRLKLHNPDCINAREGDRVVAVECRPLSKTKNFVIIKKLEQGEGIRVKGE